MKKKLKKHLYKAVGLRLNALYLIKPEKAVNKAFHLFCTPRRGRVKPHQKDFLENAKKEKITFENLQLQTYHWEGSGKTILLVHGWESNTHRWKALVEKLQQKNYNIFAFDGPAHGYSSGRMIHVPMYANCIEAISQKYKPEIIISHSVGSMSSVFHQKEFPDNSIENLVLLGPPSELTAIMADFKKVLNLSQRLMNSVEDFFVKNLNYHFQEFSIAKFAKKVKQPTLIVHDKYDKIAPVEASESIHANMSNSTFIKTEGAGHSLNNDYIHKEIIQFLEN